MLQELEKKTEQNKTKQNKIKQNLLKNRPNQNKNMKNTSPNKQKKKKKEGRIQKIEGQCSVTLSSSTQENTIELCQGSIFS